MAKPIGKGVIILIDSTTGKISSSCINGVSTTVNTYTFTPVPEDEIALTDEVLFVVNDAVANKAENVVRIPSGTRCM